MSDVVVLGAGIVGMTTAYYLARAGHAVTVIDAGDGPGEGGASFGNGAQLSYSYTDAMASPSLVRNLPKYLLGRDPAFRFRPTPSPRFWSWAASFLANATPARFEHNTVELLKLAMESRREFAGVADRFAFDHRTTGKLNLYATVEGARAAERLIRLKNAHGAEQEMLTPGEAVAREPALAAYGHSFVAALWSPHDEAGDSHRLCVALHRALADGHGVDFRFGTRVRALDVRGGRLAAVLTDRGEVPCARAVVALGVWSADIARTAGIRLPIWPMQGYSMTVPATAMAPSASITDTARKVVFCRIGDRLRIAGIADIGPRRESLDPARFESFRETARGIFPEAGDYAGELNPWTGFRPMTPDSRPIVGASGVEGLFLNCGHGSLGWTLSMATAARLAGLMR